MRTNTSRFIKVRSSSLIASINIEAYQLAIS
jgi:hypothetical protein